MNKLTRFLEKNNINKNDNKVKVIEQKDLDKINVDELQYLSNLSGFNPEAILSELLN